MFPEDSLSTEADVFLRDASLEFGAKQAALSEAWGFSSYSSWEFDPRSRVLTLLFDREPSVRAQCSLFATYCVSDQTLEWCWNNPRYPRNLVEASHCAKTFGEALGLRYLVEGIVPVPSDVYLPYLCAIALKANNALGVFRGSEADIHPLFVVQRVSRDDG